MCVRRRIACVLIFVFLSCVPAGETKTPATPVAPGTRRALLIGIDDYSASRMTSRRGMRSEGAERFVGNLRGAVRDVEIMREMLMRRYGFRDADIVILKNQDATRDAIIGAIERHLIAPAKKDDVLLFYFAGHGSQVENTSSTELDRMDESLVPGDTKIGADDLRDKELSKYFNAVLDHDASLTIIVDSCNSGSISRALVADGDVRAVRPDLRDVQDPSESPAPESRGALVLSAAKDFARAFEVIDEEGRSHGAFSWALFKAMRAAVAGEPASDTFLRAQAILHAEPPYQDAVMSGDATARLMPLLRWTRAQGAAETTIALEQIRADGTAVLQGGWADGLTVGTTLRARDHGAGDARIRITGLIGIARSEGRRIGKSRAALPPGTLFGISTWSAPLGRPLRVWIPQTSEIESARAFAKDLRESVGKSGMQWIDDPTTITPTHVLRWRDDTWELIGPGGTSHRFASDLSPKSILAQLPSDASLFLWLPAPTALRNAIAIGPGTAYDNLEEARQPANVDYVLAGRLSAAGIEYAWIRPGVLKEDETKMALPARTDWHAIDSIDDTGIIMRHAILGLYKIFAWHRLESPPGSPSPYRLILQSTQDDSIAKSTVTGLIRYALVLQAIPPSGARIPRRYYYIFGIDSYGRSVLLLPRRDSVGNRFPIEPADAEPAREIRTAFTTVTPPYGLDTYVLLSSDESLPNPSILEWSGVRTRGPRGETALEELFSLTGGSTRGMDGVDTPPVWSVDRLLIQSVPPPL
jgi:hypothetical protein